MTPPTVPFAQAARLWLKLGLLSFGGPAGQIAMLHRLVVEERKWIGNERFLHALNYCHLLPGPEAQQLATYVGWLLHGTRGGLTAGILFVLPGALVVLALSALYAAFRQVPAVDALFYGLKPAVLAVVLAAVLRLGGKALGNLFGVLLAAGSFLALFLFQTPFPLVIAAAALLGFLARKTCPDVLGDACPGWLHGQAGHGSGDAEAPGPERGATLAGSLRTLGLWLVLWLGPVAALLLILGPEHVFSRLAVFFSKMAVVTFGGAYAVLAYVAQEAVEGFGWLSPADMLNGLGLAETTPGPLILVLQFVGYLAAFRDPGTLPPVLAGILGSALTLWVTFAPCFLWIFLGAPYIERLRGVRGLGAALSGITAAVVGVVLNLAAWFGLHTLFGHVGQTSFLGGSLPLPQWSSLDPAALVLALAALAAMRLLRLGLAPTLGLCALAGLFWKLLA